MNNTRSQSNFKAANTLFKTVWTIYYQGCTENTPQHPLLGNITAPSTLHRCGFSLFTIYRQIFKFFVVLIFFGKFIGIAFWIFILLVVCSIY